MGFAGYVSVCVQLCCVRFHCLSLHVSAYMAIFRCVGYFIFICLKDSASLLFSAFFFSRSSRFHLCFSCAVFLRYYFCLQADKHTRSTAASFPGLKRKGNEANDSLPPNADVNNVGAIPPRLTYSWQVNTSLCLSN
jgi:hypothetical protein